MPKFQSDHKKQFFLVPRIRALKDKNLHLFSLSFLSLNIDVMSFPNGGTYLQKGKKFVYIAKDKSSPTPLQLLSRNRKIKSTKGRFRFGESSEPLRIAEMLEKSRNNLARMQKENRDAVQKSARIQQQGRPLLQIDV